MFKLLSIRIRGSRGPAGPRWFNGSSRLALAAGILVFGALLGARVSGADPFVGEIRLVPFNFEPAGWAFCDGQLLPITGNEALFSLIGTTYGGDGQQTFALPDLRGRVPVGMGVSQTGTTYTIGESFGLEQVTLTTSQIPAHSHAAVGDAAIGSSDRPDGALPARDGAGVPHYSSNSPVHLAPSAIGTAGGGQAHPNMPPYLVSHYIISLFGIFPSPNSPGPPVSTEARPAPRRLVSQAQSSVKSRPAIATK